MKTIKNILLLLILPIAITAAEKPNIIFLLADDAGYADYQPYNEMFAIPDDVRIKTPHIAKLADEGLRFTNAHTTGSVCQPSRYSIISGMNSYHKTIGGTPANSGNPFIPVSHYTMPDMLKKNGYQTAMFGKWHLDYLFSNIPGTNTIDHTAPLTMTPNDAGFDHAVWLHKGISSTKYFMLNRRICRLDPQVDYATLHPDKPAWINHKRWQLHPYEQGESLVEIDGDDRIILGDVITDNALEFMEEAVKSDKPFFMYVASVAPHSPHLPNDSINNMAMAGAAKHFNGVNTSSDRQKMVYENDVILAQLMEQVKRLGIENNTIIIFSSDNGPGAPGAKNEGSSGSYRGNKGTVWEGGHRVPLIVKWPGVVAPNTISKNLVSQVDLFATFAYIIDDDNSPAVNNDSKSFLSLLKGEDVVTREWAFATKHKADASDEDDEDDINAARNMGAICSNGDKLIIEFMPENNSYNFTEYYNLNNDPSEKINLIDEPQYQAKLDSLRNYLDSVYMIRKYVPGQYVLEPFFVETFGENGSLITTYENATYGTAVGNYTDYSNMFVKYESTEANKQSIVTLNTPSDLEDASGGAALFFGQGSAASRFLIKNINTSGYDSIRIAYHLFKGSGAAADIFVRYSVDLGSTWIELPNAGSVSSGGWVAFSPISKLPSVENLWIELGTQRQYTLFDDIMLLGISKAPNKIRRLKTKKAAVYPNPSQGSVSVSSDENVINMELVNLEGKVMRKLFHSNTMSLSGIKSGTYLLRYETNTSGKYVEKIIVSN